MLTWNDYVHYVSNGILSDEKVQFNEHRSVSGDSGTKFGNTQHINGVYTALLTAKILSSI